MKKRFLFLFLFTTLLVSAGLLRAAPQTVGAVTVDLIAEQAAAVPGQTLTVALDFELETHWHLYWENPGASGLPVEIEWELPEGFVAGEIEWPAPERIELGGLMSYAYEDTVTLMVPISVPATAVVGESVTITGDAFWLACKEQCMPGDAKLSLELPVAATASPSEFAGKFEAARAALPIEGAPWGIAATLNDGALLLTIEQGSGPSIPEDLYLYVDVEGIVDPNEPQVFEFVSANTARLQAVLDVAQKDTPTATVSGVLQSASGNWAVNLPIGETVAAPMAQGPIAGAVPAATGFEGMLLNLGLPGWLLLAFLGGFILNVMPCVLPVLSLKVFSLLKHSGQSKAQALMHGGAYTAGVVVSFLALAGVLLALRSVGERIGWGFQLQSPNFVVVLTVVFFLFALNLMGVFEIGTSLVGADTKVSKRNDALGSFGMGVLAAVVGAPCMGPLVASVSGIAVQANAATGLLIFGVMGLGLASPFLFLSVFPKLVAYLPKPGVWMESVKQFMGFLLMAAVVFLALVAGRLGGVDAVIALLIALLLAGLAAWVYGRWAVPVKAKRTQWIARLISLALLVGATYYAINETKAAYLNFESGSSVSENGQWQPWSTERVEAELAEGKPVFIDFTASWCLICQVNKKVATHSEATEALFDEYGVVALEADWTRYDPAITTELERFGRSGVPLYVLYAPDGEVTVLPQSLTNGIVREAVEKALK
ncbi:MULTISPECIES: protein-disulfide reductase DsbD [unclassified Lentimonas]|uniref:protein-disulfide reductase DsbD family protein n=1 Tax=unclassified Lentimonas TaxID=2630993 RepID=UPI0013898C21|nr:MULTISPECIES: protein-disulfide reductase DsbD domain-containing protein [unclassified Lentimonas]